MASHDELERRIQSLPQELQDEILGYTLYIKPDAVTVAEGPARYKPPWQLSVNRATRRTVAKHYYSTSTFHFDLKSHSEFEWLHFFKKWLGALMSEDRLVISDIRIHCFGLLFDHLCAADVDTDEEERGHAGWTAQHIRTILESLDLQLQAGALKCDYSTLALASADAGSGYKIVWKWTA